MGTATGSGDVTAQQIGGRVGQRQDGEEEGGGGPPQTPQGKETRAAERVRSGRRQTPSERGPSMPRRERRSRGRAGKAENSMLTGRKFKKTVAGTYCYWQLSPC